MTDEERARLAKRLSEDPLFPELMAYLRETVVRDWMSTAQEATDRREIMYHKNIALTELEQQILIWSRLT